MVRVFFCLFLCLLSQFSRADILIIGDSHTVGPFGSLLHRNLANKFPEKLIAVYGHSSSAPLHWMSEKPSLLSGGTSHHVSFNDHYLEKTPDWRIKQFTLNFINLMKKPVHHPEWQDILQIEPRVNTVIIALGANDRAVVKTEFKKRLKILDEMISETVNEGINASGLDHLHQAKAIPHKMN